MEDLILVSAKIALNPEVLSSVVKNSKLVAKERGESVDPAESLNQIITRFLQEKDFKSYVDGIENYT